MNVRAGRACCRLLCFWGGWSFLRGAQSLAKFFDIYLSFVFAVCFLHQFVQLLLGHLRAHVLHVLLEFGGWDRSVSILVQLLELLDQVLVRVHLLQFSFHYQLKVCESNETLIEWVDFLSAEC